MAAIELEHSVLVDSPPPSVARRPRRPTLRLTTESANVLTIWLASRIAVFVMATYSTWVLVGDPLVHSASDPESVPPLGPVATWNRLDLAW